MSTRIWTLSVYQRQDNNQKQRASTSARVFKGSEIQ